MRLLIACLGAVCIAATGSAAFDRDNARRSRGIAFEALLGTPGEPCAKASGITVTATRPYRGGTLAEIEFAGCGMLSKALLARPRGAVATAPLVLALHQTTKEASAEVMGLAGDRALAIGERFFDAGYVVLAPDVFLAGRNYDPAQDWDTQAFYEQQPAWSAVGRMLTEHRLALDALESAHFAPSCIVSAGHSLGGHNALFLARADARIDVTIASAAFDSIAEAPDAMRWARVSGFTYAPQLRPWLELPVPRVVPFDFDDIVGAIAPRAVFLSQGDADPVFPNVASFWRLAATAAHRFKANGAERRFEVHVFAGGHVFPDHRQTAAVKFANAQCATVRR